MPANPLINVILGSCLARAQTLHPVKVCHHLFEPNHAHMLLAVDNPDDVPAFMERFKTESAHAINKLLGRRKRTIWCEGYDSPPVLTISSVIARIVYIYTNPSKDGLENSIDRYPGLSSWKAFKDQRNSEETYPRIRRFMVPNLSKDPSTNYRKAAKKLENKIKSKHTFKTNPDAWMDCFQIFEENERKAFNAEILEKVKEAEKLYKVERAEKGLGVIGRKKLSSSPMIVDYVSLKKGRRMICISDDIELRRATIDDIRAREDDGRAVLAKWRRGDLSHSYPMGLFPPSMPKLSEPYSSYGFALGEF